MLTDLRRGLADTNIVIFGSRLDIAQLPDELAISAITLAELAAGVLLVRGDDAVARDERARRLDLLQRVEHAYEPLPFDASAARAFGRISGAVADHGRSTRRRIADMMIAAVAAANDLDLYTTDPDDYLGLDGIVTVVVVPRP